MGGGWREGLTGRGRGTDLARVRSEGGEGKCLCNAVHYVAIHVHAWIAVHSGAFVGPRSDSRNGKDGTRLYKACDQLERK